MARAEVTGGYLNFFYDRKFYAESVLQMLGKTREDWGRSEIGAGRTVVIDYSSVNIAKAVSYRPSFRARPLAARCIRYINYLGYNVVGVNHLGDWGTQFGKLIAAYKMWGTTTRSTGIPYLLC